MFSYEKYLKEKRINYKHITYNQINEYIKYLKDNNKYNNSSINRHLSTLRSFYNFLLREGIVSNNPYKLIKGPKKQLRLPNYMKYNEFEMMLESCDNTPLGIRNRCLLEVLLATGARVSEIVNIKGNKLTIKLIGEIKTSKVVKEVKRI